MTPSVAEALLSMTEELMLPKNSLICCDRTFTPEVLTRIAIGLRLRKAPKVVQLRAMAEGWTLERIVRELH